MFSAEGPKALNPDPEDRKSADYADYTDLGGWK
jgi:hypothetical protein